MQGEKTGTSLYNSIPLNKNQEFLFLNQLGQLVADLFSLNKPPKNVDITCLETIIYDFLNDKE